MLSLLPAWDCKPYLSTGYGVRPYGDFGLTGKLTKFLIPKRDFSYLAARRLIYPLRDASWKLSSQPTRLRCHRLDPTTRPIGSQTPTRSIPSIRTRWGSGFAVAAMSA